MSRTTPWSRPFFGERLSKNRSETWLLNEGCGAAQHRVIGKCFPRHSVRCSADRNGPVAQVVDPFVALTTELRLRVLFHLFTDTGESDNSFEGPLTAAAPCAVASRRATETFWAAQRSVRALLSAFPSWAQVLLLETRNADDGVALPKTSSAVSAGHWTGFWTKLTTQVFGCHLTQALYTVRLWSSVARRDPFGSRDLSSVPLAQLALLAFHEPCHCCGIRQAEPDLFHLWDGWMTTLADASTNNLHCLCMPVCRYCFLADASADWAAQRREARSQEELAVVRDPTSSIPPSSTGVATSGQIPSSELQDDGQCAPLAWMLMHGLEGRVDMGYSFVKAREQVYQCLSPDLPRKLWHSAPAPGDCTKDRQQTACPSWFHSFMQLYQAQQRHCRLVSDAAPVHENASGEATRPLMLSLITQQDLVAWARRQRHNMMPATDKHRLD